MRATIAGLVNPHPLVTELPAAWQGQEFTTHFLTAFDDALAPIMTTIDTFDAYLDPALAPPDFLPWLAGWLGLELDENWSEQQQRRLVARAVDLLSWQGTHHGTRTLIRHFLGIDPDRIELADSGGVAWSVTPDGAVPGDAPARLQVRVAARDVDQARLRRLVRDAVPAHVAVDVEVVAT